MIADLRSRLRVPSTQGLVTAGVLTAAILFVFSQLNPSLLLKANTPAGGDMGSHVWLPAYLRDHLLAHGRITGWTPDWYAGFPALHFYFPIPSLLIVLFNVVLPYGVAFKLVTVLGVLSLPLAAYAFGRLSGMPFPGPALMGVATVPFLFERSFTIYGGNIPSTLAGEFSFSLSLSIGLVFLGVLARGLDTGRHRALAAGLLALTGLCHVIPTLFIMIGVVVLLLQRFDRKRVIYVAQILLVAGLIVGFWLIPFEFRLAYTNDMGWEKITQFGKNLFPPNLRWLVALAAAGAIGSVALFRRTGTALVGMAAAVGAVFVLAPQSRLWNARFLPFWFLCLYLLAGLAIAEVALAISTLVARDPDAPSAGPVLATPAAVLIVVLILVGTPLKTLPSFIPTPATKDTSFIPAWVKWNYSGYEGKKPWPEYHHLMQTMGKLPCGRAMWEYDASLDRYGTPMALMLLPYWTHSCIGSMEGLYFESSATTPYHFLNAAELSKAPSNPQRDLPYKTIDVADGVKHLQMIGARYYMAFSKEAISQADANPDLRLVAESKPWRIYEVAGSALVAPLANQPAVVEGIAKGGKPWMSLAVRWYQDPTAWDVPLAASGPDEWQRVTAHQTRVTTKTVGAGMSWEPPIARPVRQATVTHIKAGDDRISFDVDRVGTPVVVKASYFPNWQASGGRGPWRVTPNLMVVIPTSRHVSVHYGYTPVDALGWLLTIVGLAAVVVLARRPPVEFPEPPPRTEEPAATEEEPVLVAD